MLLDGTGGWVTTVTQSLNIYMGYDVVNDLVQMGRSRNSLRLGHFFSVADITTEVLPKADAILCRDCLVHLPFYLALRAISNS